MTELIDIESIIIPPERQLHTHPHHEKLVDSILHLGLVNPIVVSSETCTLIKGLGRLKACKALRMKTIQAIIVPESEIKAYKCLISHTSIFNLRS